MNDPSAANSQEHPRAPILGPAVPPKGEPEPFPLESLPEPLAPFIGGAEAESAPGGGAAGSTASDAASELPWLGGREPGATQPGGEDDGMAAPEAPSYLGGVPEVSLGEEDPPLEIPRAQPVEPARLEEGFPHPSQAESLGAGGVEPDAGFIEPALPEREPSAAETTAGEPEPVPIASLEPDDWSGGAPPATAPELHVEQAGGFGEPGPELFDEVADRLERIARSLRGRSAAEVFASSGDPLEILIAGYALGYADGRRRPGKGSGPSA